jgi:alpha-glucosidase
VKPADVRRATQLRDALHARGIKLLLDLVPAHTSDQHPWFLASSASRHGAMADWYVWADPRPDGTPPNNWLSHFGGPAWRWVPRRAQYVLHHFAPQQPNLNYRCAAVRDALLAAAAFWLRRGADGFRVDALHTLFCDPALADNPARPPDDPARSAAAARANPFHLQVHERQFNRHADVVPVLRRLRALADEAPGRLLLCEVNGMAASRAYTAGGDAMHASYNFDLLFPGPPSPARLAALLDSAGDMLSRAALVRR